MDTTQNSQGQNPDNYEKNKFLIDFFFNSMPSGVIIYKVLNDGLSAEDYIIKAINPSALRLDDLQLSPAINKSIAEIRPGVEKFGLIPVFRKVWQTGRPAYYPSHVYIDQQNTDWYENRIFRLPCGRIAAVYDKVTKGVENQEKLRLSEERYRYLAENTSDIIWTADLNFDLTYVSPSIEKLLGVPAGEYKKAGAFAYFTDASVSRIKQKLHEELLRDSDPNIDKERIIALELQRFNAAGRIIYVSVNIKFMRDAAGKPIGLLGSSRDITAMKRAEMKAEKNEKMYRLLYSSINQGVIFYTPDEKIISANPAAERILGLKQEEIIKKSLVSDNWETRFEDGSLMAKEQYPLRIAMRTGQPSTQVFSLRRKNKAHKMWISVEAIPLFRDGESKPFQAYAIFEDITKQYNAKENYKLLFNQLQIGIAQLEVIYNEECRIIDFRVLDINPAFETIFRLKRPECISRMISDLAKDMERHWVGEFTALIGQTEILSFKDYSAALDKHLRVGAYKSVEDRITITLLDISDKINADKERHKALQRNAAFLAHSPSPISIYDEKGNFLDISESMARLLDLSSDDIIGKNVYDLFPREFAANMIDSIELIKETGLTIEKEEQIDINGVRIVLKCLRFAIQMGSGADLIFGCIANNITERRQMEKSLLESERRHSRYIESAPYGVFVVDRKGQFIETNKAVHKMLGYSKKNLLKMRFNDILSGDSIEAGKKHFRAALKNGTAKSVLSHRHSDGNILWGEINSVKLNNNEVLSFVNDISEQKKTHDRVVYIGYHDALTGLYNRSFLDEKLIGVNKKKNMPLSIIMADINGLKLINDSFGYQAGDELLKKVAQTLASECTEHDIVARLGGDEFVLLLPRTDEKQAGEFISRVQASLAEERIFGLEISVSFGFAVTADKNEDITSVLIEAENNMYKHKIYAKASIHSKTIDIIMDTLFVKSKRELYHSQRVSAYCEMISILLGLDNDTANMIKTAGLLHDIGKIGVDERILNKTQKLNNSEWVKVMKHPEIGWRILASSSGFEDLASYVLEHHERWDGTGYPKGIKGEEITLGARIIAIADAYDAMTSSRTYNNVGLDKDEAIAELKKCAGSQFDPNIIDVFINGVLLRESST